MTNTGNTVINQIDFSLVISRTDFPVSKSDSYSATSLGLQPGEKRKISFSQAIPADYSGISTAGPYRLDVTAQLGGTAIGTYSKNIQVV